MTNRERIHETKMMLIQFQDMTQIGNSPAEAITDCLANLRHFAHAMGIDFDNCNRIAEGHFSVEKGLKGKRPNRERPRILIEVEGGVVHNVEGAEAAGVIVEVRDSDAEGADACDIEIDSEGNQFVRSEYGA